MCGMCSTRCRSGRGVNNAGTDASVFITLMGTRSTVVDKYLDNPGHNDFERGRTDAFTFGNNDLGDLTRVRIRHNNSGDRPGWFLEDIRVWHSGSVREWIFPCHRWLARTADDGSIDRILVPR